ncbi:MAG: MFS transporter [Patescibacteria group bacterium]|nr:MFS transporter [Patescibacteria group bacterium]MBU1953152.1 MFS transporter [Patescibacteria group bacterium]
MKLNIFIKSLVLNDCIFWFSNYLFLSIASIHISKNMDNGSTLTAGVSFGTYFLFRGITDLVSPHLHKKLSTKNKVITLILCVCAVSAAFFLLSFVNNAYLAIVLFAAIGISLGIYNPIKYAVFSLHLDKSKEEKEWGLMDGVGLISIALASYLGSYLAEKIGFVYLLRISSLGFLLSTLPLLLRIPSLRKYIF